MLLPSKLPLALPRESLAANITPQSSPPTTYQRYIIIIHGESGI